MNVNWYDMLWLLHKEDLNGGYLKIDFIWDEYIKDGRSSIYFQQKVHIKMIALILSYLYAEQLMQYWAPRIRYESYFCLIFYHSYFFVIEIP